MTECEIVGFCDLGKLELALAQRDALARACQRAVIDLRAAKVLAQLTLGEPHGINQTIDICESALEGYRASVGSAGERGK